MTGGKLKGVNMLSFVVMSMISIRLVSLPGEVIEHAKNDAWISVLITAVVAYLTAYISYYIATEHPGYNFAQVHTKLFGGFIGKLIMMGFTIYVIILAGFSLRLFADTIKMFLLDRTPSVVIIMTTLFACVYCLMKGIKTISIVFDMMFPVVFFIIFIALMTYKNAEINNILPIAYTGIKPIMRGSAHIIDSAVGCSIVSYIMPYFENAKETKKWIFIGVTIAISVYMVLIVMCLLVFGIIEVQYLSFPAILLAKIIEFKAELFERTESFFMAAWIPGIFANIVIICTTAILNLKEIFNTKKTNRIILLIVPFIIISTFIPKNIIDVYDYLELGNKISVYLTLIYFPILFIVVMLNGRRNRRYEK